MARFLFDVGLGPWDAGPVRCARYLDVLGLLSSVPLEQGPAEGVGAVALGPSSGLS